MNWTNIIKWAEPNDWISLEKVCREAKAGVEIHLTQEVLPLLKRLTKVEAATLSAANLYFRLHMELDREIPFSATSWHKEIHLTVKTLLKGENHWERLADLIQAKVDINAFTSGGSTPLLLVCNSLPALFKEREGYERPLKLAKQLLEGGADPNLQGHPSTPLVTVISQQPFGPEERELMQNLLHLLIQFGADPHRIPENDTFDFRQSPLEMAEKQGLLLE